MVLNPEALIKTSRKLILPLLTYLAFNARLRLWQNVLVLADGFLDVVINI
jgi:hypothetical protein